MKDLNKLLVRQAEKYLGGVDNIPENYHAFIQAINESYNHYEKDHHLLERSIELSSEEMIELNEQLRKETKQLKQAHEELRATEIIRLEKRLDEEKIKKLQEISEVGIAIQERERIYLGAELHDNINQILATSMLYIDTAIRNEDTRLELITDSKTFIDKAIQEIRTLSKSLLPPILSQTSLTKALDNMVHDIQQVDKLQIITHWENIDESLLCEKMKLNIFRIVQEQLNNIFKHANATTVIIELTQPNEGLQLSIKDDGVGFDTSQKRVGIGLQNIISRTNLFNGEVIIKSKPSEGCELIVKFNKHIEPIELSAAS